MGRVAIIPVVLTAMGGWSGIWAGQPEKYTLMGGGITPSWLFVFILVVILSYNGGTWGLAQR